MGECPIPDDVPEGVRMAGQEIDGQFVEGFLLYGARDKGKK